MKKIFTLFFAVVLISAAAIAQDGRHRRSDQSYPSQYQSNNGYGYSKPYDNSWSYGNGRIDRDGRFNEDHQGWDRDNITYGRGRFDNRYESHHRRMRRGFSMRLFFGNRHSEF